ncbi:cell division protein SepF [Candidatus Woesearchaeota archaeon]|nr:cell division protein SepF [Candidatus Woesearchaeota archaeon]
MKDLWLQLKDKFLRPAEAESEQEGQESYVELDSTGQKEEKGKVVVRPFVMEEFEDIRQVLDVLREGTTVALINIKPLRDKDLVELKRAIAKLRKTCEAIDGDIAGVGEDYVVAVPYFARIHRNGGPVAAEEVETEARR